MSEAQTSIFGGFIEPARCECHKGQFSLVVGRMENGVMMMIGNRNFKTQKEAEDKFESTVKEISFAWLKLNGQEIGGFEEIPGLTPEAAAELEKAYKDPAAKNHTLH